MNTLNVALGALAGLAVGAVAGILFAPKKGSATRQQIIDKGSNYVEEIESKMDEFQGTLVDNFKSFKKDSAPVS